MQYIKVTFESSEQDIRDLIVAILSDKGYDGFEETEQELYAYIPEDGFDEVDLATGLSFLNIPYNTMVIPAQNWNALWESNFQPVIVDDFCTIRAHFHDIAISTPYEIVITPKMSFGTGHHATTQLMMSGMRQLDFAEKSVLDFGTGTGVLAILAEMLGAESILAIDNDQWSVENAEENIVRNQCSKITVKQSSLESSVDFIYDIILANINRHILLQYMPDLHRQLNKNGEILMSGLLLADKDIIIDAANEQGLQFIKCTEQNNWIALLFIRN